jgi:hypothetical protein
MGFNKQQEMLGFAWEEAASCALPAKHVKIAASLISRARTTGCGTCHALLVIIGDHE